MRRAGGKHYWKLPDDVTGSAEFSPCGEHRYSLTRKWPESGPVCAFVGLNPSTADEEGDEVRGDDPTVRTCWLRAREWGFGEMVMLNLLPYRATLPTDMRAAESRKTDIIGDNDRYLNRWVEAVSASAGEHRYGEGGMVIAAWGVLPARHRDRGSEVTSILAKHGPVYCLALTRAGYPRHPRGLRRDTTPRLYWAKET